MEEERKQLLIQFFKQQEENKKQRHIDFVKNFDRSKFKKVVLKNK